MTTSAQSPGACAKTPPHGTTVRPGVKGKFHGFLAGTVSGGTLNTSPKCDAAAACATTGGFVTTFFGKNAVFSCTANSADCKFDFSYSAPKQHLALHAWRVRGSGAGTMVKRFFAGDISLDKVPKRPKPTK